MNSRISTVCLFLISCLLVYAVIWKKVPEGWSGFKTVTRLAMKSRFYWMKEEFTNTTRNTTQYYENPPKNTGKNNKTAVTGAPEPLVRTPPSGGSTNATVMTPLFKKQFKKQPEWDFEDDYMRNGEERQPVCSKSLQLSKDKEFQGNATWDIQLWLYNGHLDVSTWNRLAHFNNPFGFMEYNYTDIKPAVDMIPKPKSTRLLAVPKGSPDGCIRCAVVGTGGILNSSKMGKEIDSHDYVFRVNGAVIKGFEDDVGIKTSVYVHTSFSVSQGMIILPKYGFKGIPNDEGIKYVLIPEGLRDYDWIRGLIQKQRLTSGSYRGYRPYTNYKQNITGENFYVLHPDFLRYVRNRFLKSKSLKAPYWHIYRPTNGAFALFLALHTCDIVDVYGFITEDHQKYNNYYYERNIRTKVIFYINHDYNLEITTWKKLHDSGIIRLYQGQKNQDQNHNQNQNQTSTT